MDLSRLQNEKVLVIGFGLTGQSVARFLQSKAIAFDIADECDLNRARAIEDQYVCKVITEFTVEYFTDYGVLILSPGFPRSHPSISAAIDSGKSVVGDVELFAGVVDKPVLAVTGSNGKSTVVAWLEFALNKAGIKAIACGNIGMPVLDSLQQEADVYVVELSSYQLESTYSLVTEAAVVLNVSEDHMDRYKDIEHYASVKRTIYNKAKRAVFNFSDTRTWPTKPAGNDECFDISANGDSQARWCRKSINEEWWLYDGDTPLVAQAELNLPGDHNAANALVVAALANAVGISSRKLQDGLIEFSGLKHRSEFLGEKLGIRWYNDSKGTNVDACRKAILSMQRPVLLIAGGISKGANFHSLRDVVSRHVKILILLGRDKELIEQQLRGVTRIVLVDTLESAVALAKDEALAGDSVLLSPACSSFDMFNNFEDRGNKFSQAVAEVLAA